MEAVQPRERDWHFNAVIPLLRHGHLKDTSWTMPKERCFSPSSATPRCHGYSLSLGVGGLQPGKGTYGPLSVRWFLISNVMNIKMGVSRHSVPTGFMTIGSGIKKRHPIYFLAQFPLKLLFSAYLPTFFQSFWPRRWAMFLAGDMQQNCESVKNTRLL